MFITIKDGNTLTNIEVDKISLPYIYKGIEISKRNNNLYLSLKKGYFFEDRDKVRRIEYKRYLIKHKDLFNDIEILVYENNKGIDDYRIYNNESFVYIGSEKGNIINVDPYLKDYCLIYKDGILKGNCDFLLVNGKSYNGEKLKSGDEVSLYNFKFIYYEEFLYMNNFMVKNNLPLKQLPEIAIKYDGSKPKTKNYFLPAKKELIIDKVKDFNEIKHLKQKSLVYQIGPSITMSLAMLSVTGINVYNNYQNGQDITSSIVYILMPITMLISGVIWPLLTRNSENKSNNIEIKENRDKYLDYLSDYSLSLNKNINDYLKQEKGLYFDGTINEDKLFYLTNKSNDFLKISIGYTTLSKSLEYKEVNDGDVNEKLSEINYRLHNIDNCPLFVDIKKYQIISFVSNRNKKLYFIKKILLELSSKYHYDDFYLAIYSEDLNLFSDFFGLPQLIYGNSRLTLNKKRELQDLNNLKLDRPLVVLANDKVDFAFTNKQIHLLSFINNKDNMHKESEILIEYKDNDGILHEENEVSFTYQTYNIPFVLNASILSNYQRINYLTKTITFKDVYKDFPIYEYYTVKQNGLRADFASVGKELLSFDLHESKNGPHGLIGGSTGSGKSELIVSMLLSLCLRYRPDYLNIVLIDYKGGGIKESLSYKGKTLPHIIASIDNLENDTFQRLIVAIDRECKRRQKLFKELSNKTMSSIMNIDDYLESDFQKYGLPNIAHLLIVVDEFAQLKKENPEIIKELVSFSRIGRSLGLHLILATQRPSGVIDEEIWSNSRFKIALKVQSEKDSNDIIHSKDAAYLNNPGEFYLSVDDGLIKAKSFYSKSDVNDNDAYKVALLDNSLKIVNKKEVKSTDIISLSSYINEKILDVCDKLNIKTEKMVFEKPTSKTIKELNDIYHDDCFVLGEVDDYLNASKYSLKVDLNKNSFIYSNRNEINNILNNVKKKTIVIGSKKYSNKYISDSLVYDESDDIEFLFKYLTNHKENLTIVIEDLNCLLSYDDNYLVYLLQIIRKSTVLGINVIAISRQSSLNFKLLNSFDCKYAIDINDKQDLINIYTCGSKYAGKSFFFDEELISFIPCLIEEIRNEKSDETPVLKKIPDLIRYERKNGLTLLGYDIESREKVYLKDNETLMISSYDDDLIDKYNKIYKDNENICVKLYDKDLSKDRSKYLWLNNGIFSQRLFYADRKDDLEDGYGYYFKGNRGLLIKYVNE